MNDNVMNNIVINNNVRSDIEINNQLVIRQNFDHKSWLIIFLNFTGTKP